MAVDTSRVSPLETMVTGRVDVNPDLQKERDTASFDTRQLTDILNGGKDVTERKHRIEHIIFRNEAFRYRDRYHQTMSERYEAGIRKLHTLTDLFMKNGWDQGIFDIVQWATRMDIPVFVHFGMFIPVLERLGTDEQNARWLPKARNLQIIGTYAQTELGHGTNLRGLETTATYDVATEQFVLNTPLPSGMKFWPGALGKTCNHAVVMAQLFINGRNHGMQAFFMQLRDLETHMPLPGIELGAIGPRMGVPIADNGFLILRDVRIPRTNMLMKLVQVSPDGTFSKQGPDKANYGTMMLVRANIVGQVSLALSMACTVAVRYSAVRRQSELQPGAPEPQIMEFQTQQHKLFPNIALAYAIFFARRYMKEYFESVNQNELSKGVFTSLPELHSQSAGLKAFTTDLAMAGVETLRRSCGGHGYLMASGLCDLYGDGVAFITVEGENTVLYLQAARLLMRNVLMAQSGDKVFGSSAYLNQDTDPSPITTMEECYNHKLLRMAFQRRASYALTQAGKKLQKLLSSGVPQYEAWNRCAVQLVTAVKAHLDGFLATNFMEHVVVTLDAPMEIRQVLTTLCQLHALHRIAVSAGDFLESGALTVKQVEMVREAEVALYPKIRPEAVCLVDAFDWHDDTLCSALGRYDGNVYDALYETAKNGPMNATEVHPAFLKYLKPIQDMTSKL